MASISIFIGMSRAKRVVERYLVCGFPDSLPHFIRLFLGNLRSRLACEIGDLKKPYRARTHNMRCEETQLSRQLRGSRTGRTRQHQQRLARHKNIVAEPGEAAGSRPRATEQHSIAKASVCSASAPDILRLGSFHQITCSVYLCLG